MGARSTPAGDGRPDVIEGRFALGEFVGRGAFAEVFRAIDQTTGHAVAIKRLRGEVLEPTAAQRFELEAQLIARVASPHVVGLVAMAHDAQGRACMALEWLEGEDLAKRQARAPVSWALGVELVRQAALGLGALHAAGIVHRDVKPSNFLLVPRGGDATPRLVVIDLGVARVGLEPTLTLDGLRLGTPAYMSPEQARGEREVGPRADIYALGVVLYELLAGVRPFRATDPFALLAKIVLQEPVPLRVLVPELPEAIEQVVMRALAKAPEHRFATAEDLAWALGATPAEALVRAAPARGEPGAAPSVVASSELPTEAHGASSVSSVLSTTGGEQRVVTALFAGFPPGEASAGLDALAALVVAHEGTLEKTLGGRAIAVFGLVRSRGDEALRAARVALRARELVPGARLSITTCRVLATSGGGPSGEAIDRGAGGVESAAGIRLDAATARLLEERFEIGERAGQTVLVGERANASEAQGPTLFGKPTPTVGRDRELGTLDALRAECASEPVARAVLVTGAPGVGKSRVRHEFVRRVRAAGEAHDVWLARGDAISAGSPFALIAQAVRRAIGLTGSEPVEAQRVRLLARARERVPSRADPERVAVFLGELIGARWPDETAGVQLRAARQIPQLMGDQIRRAWDDWVGACLDLGPIVLLLEDLHWGDAASVRLVDAVLATHAERALLVVAFARPEVATVFPAVWSQRGVQEIRLGELTRKASERLVREALGARATDAVVARVAEASGGNAFFLEELIRAAAEGTAGDGALPDTVFAMLQTRLDALDEDARRVLRTASVFGRTFWRGGVRALLGAEAVESDAVLDARLAALGTRELVTRRDEARLSGETEYTFRHALVRDAAYATWTDADRAVAHRLAGEWLERAGETTEAVLGEHFERGGLGARAAGHYVRAARDALEGNDFEGAIALGERAIACGAAGDARIEARLYEAEASRWNGRHETAAAAAQDAWERSAPGSRAWFRAFAELVMASGRMGRHDQLSALLDELERVVPAPGAESALAHALMRAVIQALYAGHYERADKLLVRADELEVHASELEPAARGRLHELRATRALFAGDGDGFLERIPAALALFDEVGDYRTACILRGNYGYALREVGDYDGAIAALEETVATSVRFGLKLVLGPAKENLGSTLWRVGRTDEALAAVTDAVALLRASGDTLTLGGTMIALAEAHAACGDQDAAVRECDAALSMLAEHPPVRALGLAVRARAKLSRGGDDAGALQDAREAFELLEKLGDVAGGESNVRLAWMEALVRTGDRDAARAAGRVARERVHERAAKMRDPARRALFLGRIPENLAMLALADALDRDPAP